MIRMIQSNSSSHAKAYFSEALQKSDYYLNDQELQGRFLGRLADRIGVTGLADKETFFALCENINPKTGKALTPRTRENRRTGYDINFHAPKSVSILNALSKNSDIIEVFQASVSETMKDIEADAMTRVRKKGKYEDRQTGELLWAEFIHQTARPVDGSVPDPHLHIHAFCFNATWDNREKEIKAGQFGDIKLNMPYYQSRFHKKLSDKLIDLGYRIRRTDKSFEVEGVPKSVVALFSKRSNEIGEFAKEHGINDVKQLAELGARTRSKKQKGLTMVELKREWQKQIKENIEYQDGEQEMPVRYAVKRQQSKVITDDCLNYALKHSFERASVMPERRILASAYRHSIGSRSVSLDAITARFKDDAQIIRVKDKSQICCTTREVLGEEKRMVELARNGQGKLMPLYQVAPELNLTGQQADAVEHILTTGNQVSIIRGAAGTGKTTLMQEAVPLIEQAGKQVIVVAPTAEASRGVLKNEGFENAETVARLLVDKNLQKSLQNNVLWVDEAGLLGTKDMSALLTLTDQYNARLILGGDTRQHPSVIRGDALRILNTVGGIKTAEVTKIYRQKNIHYRSAVEDLSKGDVRSAFIKLTSIGAIQNVDPLNPNKPLVGDYIKAIKKGKSALIVSPTHKQGDAVTNEVRGKLKALGLLGKKDLTASKLTNLNLTEAEKSDWRNFEKGQIIQVNQNLPQLKRGSVWAVKDIIEKSVILTDGKKQERILPRDRADSYDVFKKTDIQFCKGDKIKITRNSLDENKKRLNNGMTLDVVSVSKSGEIKLLNKTSKASFSVKKDFGHIDHAYCVTSYAAQGKTVDEVFIWQPAATFAVTDAKQFYVSVSRGRDKATIYTDDRVTLLEYAAEIGDRQSALELIGQKHTDYVLQTERENYSSKNANQLTKDLLKHDYSNKAPDYEPGF